MSRDLIIRADGGDRLGLGHLMRCAALGQAWQDSGGQVHFISATTKRGILERFVRDNFQVKPVRAPYPDSADLECVDQMRRSLSPAAIIVDGYHFDGSYHDHLRSSGVPVLAIDDNAHLDRYSADVVLNPNVYAATLDYPRAAHTRLLLGARYALLRREFYAMGRSAPRMPERATKILITLGGSNTENDSLAIIRALSKIAGPLSIRVLSPAASGPTAIENEASGDHTVQVERDSESIVSLMRWADLAISGAGQTCLELAFLGVPMALCIIAENQRRNANWFENSGIAMLLGTAGSLDSVKMSLAILDLIGDRGRREQMSRRGMELVDGNGCRAALCELTAERQVQR